MEKPEREVQLAFCFVRLPWEAAVTELARVLNRIFQQSSTFEGAKPGAIGGKLAHSDEPFYHYHHASGPYGELRVRALRNDPEWTYMEYPERAATLDPKPLFALSKFSNEPVFEILSSTSKWKGDTNKASSLRICYPDGELRCVERLWDYFPDKKTKQMRKRNQFLQIGKGPIHPDENTDAYKNRKISDRLNEDELVAFVKRLGAQRPTAELTERAVIFSFLDSEIPLEPVETLCGRLVAE